MLNGSTFIDRTESNTIGFREGFKGRVSGGIYPGQDHLVKSFTRPGTPWKILAELS